MQTVSYGLQPRTQLLIVLASVTLLGVVLHMVRKRHVREQYSLLWIAACLVLMLAAVFIRTVETLSRIVGIFYPPAFLFLVAILLLVVLQVHFSVVISSLKEQSRSLTQDLGLLQSELHRLRRELSGERSGKPQES